MAPSVNYSSSAAGDKMTGIRPCIGFRTSFISVVLLNHQRYRSIVEGICLPEEKPDSEMSQASLFYSMAPNLRGLIMQLAFLLQITNRSVILFSCFVDQLSVLHSPVRNFIYNRFKRFAVIGYPIFHGNRFGVQHGARHQVVHLQILQFF